MSHGSYGCSGLQLRSYMASFSTAGSHARYLLSTRLVYWAAKTSSRSTHTYRRSGNRQSRSVVSPSSSSLGTVYNKEDGMLSVTRNLALNTRSRNSQ
jgi:hypothetical protein